MAELVCHCLACFAQCFANVHIPANSCDCCDRCCPGCPKCNAKCTSILKEWIVWSLLLTSGLLLIGLIGAGLYAASDDRNYISANCLVTNTQVSTSCLSCYIYWEVRYGVNMTSRIQSSDKYDPSQGLNHARAYQEGKSYSCYYDPDQPSHVVWSIKANTWRIIMIVFLVLWAAFSVTLIASFIVWKIRRNRNGVELSQR